MESGFLKRLFREYHSDLFTKERFEIISPQPLGINNVMFCFILLGFGICLSLLSTTVEFITRRHIMREPSDVQKQGNRSILWEIKEIKFDDGSKSSVDNRNDRIVGADGDFGVEGPHMKTLSLIETQ